MDDELKEKSARLSSPSLVIRCKPVSVRGERKKERESERHEKGGQQRGAGGEHSGADRNRGQSDNVYSQRCVKAKCW